MAGGGVVSGDSPLTTHHSLLTTHCSLLTTHHSPLTTHHSLLTTHYSLLTCSASLPKDPMVGRPLEQARPDRGLCSGYAPVDQQCGRCPHLLVCVGWAVSRARVGHGVRGLTRTPNRTRQRRLPTIEICIQNEQCG